MHLKPQAQVGLLQDGPVKLTLQTEGLCDKFHWTTLYLELRERLFIVSKISVLIPFISSRLKESSWYEKRYEIFGTCLLTIPIPEVDQTLHDVGISLLEWQ